MDFYRVIYEGLWMGGKAIVAADSPEEAIDLVRRDTATAGFQGATATHIPVPGSCVLYNDNGDY